jgi:hypothetical protein
MQNSVVANDRSERRLDAEQSVEYVSGARKKKFGRLDMLQRGLMSDVACKTAEKTLGIITIGIQCRCSETRGFGVRCFSKFAREQDIFQIRRPLIGDNHAFAPEWRFVEIAQCGE